MVDFSFSHFNDFIKNIIELGNFNAIKYTGVFESLQ